jgi:[mitogen-activated protein kinase] kinase 5
MHAAYISQTEPTNDYELLQRVGCGSFGEVFKARHVRNNSLAAIKVVKLEGDENFVHIQQEILVLKDCTHPNIISYFSSYLKREKLWIVMEYCAGGSLQDIYQMSGPLLELQIAFVCRETLKGLQYLHRRGKIHRDIKGANILLTQNGEVKLADFGVAAQITATIGKRKSFIGTPYWMAPEVASVERLGGYGFECDIWAVGITAIELAELQPPLFDLHPMQVLQLMTRSGYKPPRLKDKSKWSSTMHDFVKCCLTKSPKKRPTPDKLLNTHPFVKGALSSRLTRDLLDKLNNLGRETPREESSTPTPDDELSLSNSENNDLNLHDLYFRKQSVTSSSTSGDSPINGNRKAFIPKKPDPFPHSQSTANGFDASPNEREGSAATITCPTLRTSASEQGLLSEASAISAPQIPMNNEKSRFKIENALRFPGNSFKQKAHRTASLESPYSIRSEKISSPQIKHRQGNENDQPLSDRPVTCYGLPPTPKVPLGACFFSIFHNAEFAINCSTTWIHPTNNHQYAIFGAQEGIYMLDLYELHESQLIQIYQSNCSWLYVVDNVMMSMQGKTPYLYRHDLLQLVQQEILTQKITKKINKVPEKLKPKMFMATMRLPETKDCIQCCVRQSIFNDNLYLCCAVPGAMLLYQWYKPQAKFVLLKKHEMDRQPKNPIMKPFDLVFGNGQMNSDYPQLCYGIYEKQGSKDGFDLQMVNFNDHGKLEDFLANSQNLDFMDTETLKPFTSKRLKFDMLLKLRVVSLQQLERDTLMVAYDNKIELISIEGTKKKSDLMLTSFEFDFNIEYAIGLSDSVLAFHKHGIEGRSFFNGAKTQDLIDRSKAYEVIGTEPIIILKSQPFKGSILQKHSIEDYSRASTLIYDKLKPPLIEPETTSSSSPSIQSKPPTPPQPSFKTGVDLCILTGHVSTMANEES